MSSDAMMKKRDHALALARQEVPVSEIVKQVKVRRPKVMEWLRQAGIEPVMLRRRSKTTGSVRNTPLALSIEEGVRKRMREQEEKESGLTS